MMMLTKMQKTVKLKQDRIETSFVAQDSNKFYYERQFVVEVS